MADKLFDAEDRSLVKALSRLSVENPFLPGRVEAERELLGQEYLEGDLVWSARIEVGRNPNTARIGQVARATLQRARESLSGSLRPAQVDVALYEDLAVYVLFDAFESRFLKTLQASESRKGVAYYAEFRSEYERLFDVLPSGVPSGWTAPHLFAFLYQVRRAFHHIYSNIVGGSLPAAKLRAVVWQSIFTHDLRRYQRALFDRMGDITTLITGPTGTGKELVARAIASSRYIPFDPGSRRFSVTPGEAMIGVNLSAISPTLIEAALFGHRKGAFTGALEDRPGVLEAVGPQGSIFLDEIGELDPSIQVKLLRVLQTRAFERIGETNVRRYEGKVIAATNRELLGDFGEGRFREDLYYRLCSDLITTPSLREQLDDRPDDLPNLVSFIANWVAGVEVGRELSTEVVAWIENELGVEYGWPGNFRELEQCVRNVLLRGRYDPAKTRPTTLADRIVDGIHDGSMTADEVVTAYASLVYSRTGNYVETGRRLGLDRRTVKAKIISSESES